jgi:hypothetical protein
MTLHVKNGSDHMPAVLANFSRSGILFESSVAFDAGSRAECRMTLSLLLIRVITFWINIKYCYKNEHSFIVGAEIDTIEDKTWFDFFEEIHEFIVLRRDSAE